MEISFCSHPNTNKVIATKFGTWHDSWAVVACAKFCCDMITSYWIRAKWNFHQIWIVMEKLLAKWVPGAHFTDEFSIIIHFEKNFLFHSHSISNWLLQHFTRACCVAMAYPNFFSNMIMRNRRTEECYFDSYHESKFIIEMAPLISN